MKKDFSRHVPELRALLVLGALEHLEELYVLKRESCLSLFTLLAKPPQYRRRARATTARPHSEHARAARHLLQSRLH